MNHSAGAGECRRLASIDPAGALAEDYARLLQAIGREFPSAHFHEAEGFNNQGETT